MISAEVGSYFPFSKILLVGGISLVVQRLKFCTPNEEGLGLIPDLET